MAHEPSRRSETRLVDRHPVASFVALALALSWGVWASTALVDLSLAGQYAVLIVGAFGPATAATAVTRRRGESVRGWLASVLTVRGHGRWFALALAVPIAVSAGMLVVLVVLTGQFDASAVPTALAMLAVNLVVATLVGGGQEEFGWRGFALPHLQRRYDALTASLVVGAVWAVWHGPLFALGLPGYASLSPPLYAVTVVAFAVVFTWLYNGSGGCLPAAVLLHGTINAAVNVPPVLVGGQAALPVPFEAVLAAAFGLVALGLLARHGRATLTSGPRVRPTWAAETVDSDTDRASSADGHAARDVDPN